MVPALTVRRAETTVEMPSGGAMMIAGLLQDKSEQDLDFLPGVKDMPILGALFRSRDFLSGQTELVVIVTPYLVSATSPGRAADAGGWPGYAPRRRHPAARPPQQTFNHPAQATAGRTYQGPYGYVVE